MPLRRAAEAARLLRKATGGPFAAIFAREGSGLRCVARAGRVPAAVARATALADLPRPRALRANRRVVGYAVAPGRASAAAADALREASRAVAAEAGGEGFEAAVADIAARVAGAHDPARVVEEVVATLTRLVPASCAYVALWDRAAGMIRFPYYYEGHRRDHAPDRPFANGLTEHVLRTKRTLHIAHDFERATRRRGIRYLGSASRSWLGAPLVAGGEAVGVLAVYDNVRENAFTDRHRRVLEALASQAAAALRNADLLREAEATRARLARQQDALRRLAMGALREPDPARAIALITEEAARTIDVARMSVWLFDETRTTLRCVDLFVADRAEHRAEEDVSAASFPTYFRAVESDRTIAADDGFTDPRTAELADAYLRPLGVGALIDAPIRVEGSPIGVACHEHVGGPRAWTADEQSFAGSIADMVALVLERAKARRAEEEIRLLARVSLAASEAPGLGPALEVALKEAAVATGWALAQAWIPDSEGSRLVASPAWFSTHRDIQGFRAATVRLGLHRGEGLAGTAWEAQRIAWMRDVSNDPRFLRGEAAAEAGLRTGVAVPVVAGGRVVAVLEFFLTEPRDEDPRLLHLLGALAGQLASIVERKRAEDALRAQMDLYTTLLTAQSDLGMGFVLFDPVARRVVYANDAIARIGGRTGDDLRNMDLSDLVTPENQAVLAKRIEARLRGEPVDELYEIGGSRADGSKIDLEVAAKPLVTADGPRVVALVRDITERKRAERELLRLQEELKRHAGDLELLVAERTHELARAKANLETVFRHTGDGFLFVDEERRLVSANARFAEFFDLDPDEIVNGDPEEVRRKARARYVDPRKFEAGLAAYEEDRRHLPMSIVSELVDGRVLEEESLPIFEEGRYAGRVWTYHDITERKRLEEELLRYAQTLEAEVDRRTQKLLQSAKMAALGQLVAGVAHEINNPLAFVTSNTATLRDEIRGVLADERVREVLAGRGDPARAVEALRASGHLAFLSADADRLLEMNMRGLTRIRDIVQRLRTFAAPQAPRMEPTDLEAVVRETAAIFLAQFAPRIRLDERYDPLPPVVCDPGQIGQVMMNLLVNAGQAIPGEGTVTVRLAREGDDVAFIVTDTGEGIPADVASRVFDPFFTTKEKGTGLGLSITYSIVKEHRGDISLESEPGKGTTVKVTLPLGG